MELRVTLHLEGHCVETAARKEFKRLMDALFDETGDAPELEARIELVRAFLDTADFPALRASDERLAGDGSVTVIIARSGGGDFSIEYA